MIKNDTWWNGNKTRIWRVIVIAIITGLLSTGGWMFTTVRDVPAKYVNKEELRLVVNDQKAELRVVTITQNIKLDKIDKEVTEINRFLRDYFSRQPRDGD